MFTYNFFNKQRAKHDQKMATKAKNGVNIGIIIDKYHSFKSLKML